MHRRRQASAAPPADPRRGDRRRTLTNDDAIVWMGGWSQASRPPRSVWRAGGEARLLVPETLAVKKMERSDRVKALYRPV